MEKPTSKTIQVPRHIAWRMDYRNDRYMEALSLEDLMERFSDLMANILTHSADAAKIAPIGILENESYWIGLTHVLEEMDLRRESYQQPSINMTHMVIPRSERVLKSMALAGRKVLLLDNCHYKFGKREHMEALVNSGCIRIAPASSFASSDLNGARRDNELSLATRPSIEHLRSLCNRDGIDPPSKSLSGDQGWTYVTQAKTDYFLYCLALRFDHRLFDDFEADSCVVIRDPLAFQQRLRSRVEGVLVGWKPYSTQVDYIDPMFPPVETLNPFFCKHFRFYYQREYRHFWIPAEEPPPLKPFFMDLGSLTDIAEVVPLD